MSGRKPASYKKPRNRISSLIGCRAWCTDCPWKTDGKNSLAIGCQHAGTYNHQVRAHSTIGVTYNPKEVDHAEGERGSEGQAAPGLDRHAGRTRT